jgi:hypothetical protein
MTSVNCLLGATRVPTRMRGNRFRCKPVRCRCCVRLPSTTRSQRGCITCRTFISVPVWKVSNGERLQNCGSSACNSALRALATTATLVPRAEHSFRHRFPSITERGMSSRFSERFPSTQMVLPFSRFLPECRFISNCSTSAERPCKRCGVGQRCSPANNKVALVATLTKGGRCWVSVPDRCVPQHCAEHRKSPYRWKVSIQTADLVSCRSFNRFWTEIVRVAIQANRKPILSVCWTNRFFEDGRAEVLANRT